MAENKGFFEWAESDPLDMLDALSDAKEKLQQEYTDMVSNPVNLSPNGATNHVSWAKGTSPNAEWGVDFETYSAADIFDVGLDNYFADPTTIVLMAGLYTEDGSWGASHVAELDFITDPASVNQLYDVARQPVTFDAHNAMFEELCFKKLGVPIPTHRFKDSATMSRLAGAASALESAAPQLLGRDKEEMGKVYIQIFSRPHLKPEKIAGLMIPAYQTPENMHFNPQIIKDFPDEWKKFRMYCLLDAKLGYLLARYAKPFVLAKEFDYDAVTRMMNRKGWPVDYATVVEFHARYLRNLREIEREFRLSQNAPSLNLNSLPQLKAWCKDRGINAKSFDTNTVAKMKRAIEKKIDAGGLPRSKQNDYEAVHHLLRTKQELGGSSLKKLEPLIMLTSADGILRDSYMHAGAGATARTTGKGVQMQNLKRLTRPATEQELMAIETLAAWTNEKMAGNMRQLFRSKDPLGQIIVGDFSSVESRGLAWCAGANWKLQAYRDGKDMYKVLASSPEMYGVPYEDVTKDQRQGGKVGELSCGYQAAADAVQSFAEGMGITNINAPELVRAWRAINPEIVALWHALDAALRTAVEEQRMASVPIGPNGEWRVELHPITPPSSLSRQHDAVHRGVTTARSIMMDVVTHTGELFLRRVIHGVYPHGRGLRYYKPTSRKTGNLWTDEFTNPKTKQIQHYTIYGGKLSGLLTQSFCREMFMIALRDTWIWTEESTNVDLIGQFHDEIVLDWVPPATNRAYSLDEAKARLQRSMTYTEVPGFPLDAEINSSYRYIK